MLTIAAVGCQSGQGGGGGLGPTAAGAVAVGDWNDVNAAVLAAVGQNETAVVSSSSTDTTQTFKLKTVRDELGTLVARRDTPAGAGDLGPIPIHLSASIGLFGNDKLERAILGATRQRLENLAGVDYRPLK